MKIQQTNQCNCNTCPGKVSALKGEFGGMYCLCSCHQKKITPPNERPTPLTDAVIRAAILSEDEDHERLAKHARELERKLAQVAEDFKQAELSRKTNAELLNKALSERDDALAKLEENQ